MLSKRTVFFHIGGQKTGTSAIQAFLAKNQKGLYRESGLHYPISSSHQKALEDCTTSGNAAHLAVEPNQKFTKPSKLWSSENLFVSKKFRTFLQSNSNLNVVLICYYRNPSSWAKSRYLQLLQMGEQRDFDSFLAEDQLPNLRHMQEWIELSVQENVELRAYNYSNHRRGLLSHFLQKALGISGKAASEKPFVELGQKVNRSLSFEESMILLGLNRGTRGSPVAAERFSKPLIDGFPQIAPHVPAASQQAPEEYMELCRPLVRSINQSLPSSEHMDIEDDTEPRGANLSPRTDAHSHYWVKIGELMAENPGRLTQKEIDKLRDIAVSMKNSSSMQDEAVEVMKIAFSQRPGSNFMREKLRAWAQSGTMD